MSPKSVELSELQLQERGTAKVQAGTSHAMHPPSPQTSHNAIHADHPHDHASDVARRKFNLVEFSLVCLAEFVTYSLVILLLAIPASHREAVYWVYAATTYPRIAVFIYAVIRLSRKHCWKYFFMVDNLALLMLLVDVAYVGLNWEPSPAAIFSSISYILLLFFLSAHYRTIVRCKEWTRARLIPYKILRAYGVVLYMIIAVIILYRAKLEEEEEKKNGGGGGGGGSSEEEGNSITKTHASELNPDLFLLFVVNTVVFMSEGFFAISRFDGTERFGTSYKVKDEE